MKAILPFLIALAFYGPCVSAQKINFETDSLSAVLLKAKQLDKPVFILVSAPALPAEAPKHVRESQNSMGLSKPEVSSLLNSQFLNYQAPFESAAARKLKATYSLRSFPALLYLNPDGNLIHRNEGNFYAAQPYLDDIKMFREKQKSTHNLSHYQREYSKGRREADFLRTYLLLHKELALQAAPELLDAYALSLEQQGAYAYSEVVFIHEFGPVVGSSAYRYALHDRKLVDSLYSTLPLTTRIDINNKIIANTLRMAIATNDRSLAEQGALFARNSWSGNPERGQQAYLRNMLSFYRGTQDTANFLLGATSYYNRYFMAIPVDSAAKIVAHERKVQQERQAGVSGVKSNPKPIPGQRTETKVISRLEPSGSQYATELNNAAYQVYLAKPKSNLFLLNAANWSRRTIEIEPSVPHYDTFAHLMYSLENYTAAEEAMVKAIALAKAGNMPTGKLDETLSKIRSRKL